MILFNPFYETISSVRQNLSIGLVGIDLFPYKADLSLIINDSLNQYFGKEPMIEFNKRLVKYATERRKSGISILSDMGPYFFKMLYKELVDYELSLPIQYDMPLKGLCIYNQLDFDNRLTEKQRVELVNHHGKVIKLRSI